MIKTLAILSIVLTLLLGSHLLIHYSAVRGFGIAQGTLRKTPFTRCKRVLKPGGTYLTTVPTLTDSLQMKWTSLTSSQQAMAVTNAYRPASEIIADLSLIRDLMEAGSLSPVIDRTYPLDQIVEAHRYVDGGHKKGNVIVTVHSD